VKPHRDITDPTVAKALAHPLRTRILASLEGRTASPSELAAELDAPLGVLSYHVRRLTALGFVKLVRRVPRRGAVEHYYTATARPRITNEAWGATPAVVKQATLGAALGQIGAYVSAAADNGGFDPPESHLSRSPITVDQEGWRTLAGELDALVERARVIEEESKKRLMKAEHAGQREAAVVLMLFESPADPAASISDGDRMPAASISDGDGDGGSHAAIAGGDGGKRRAETAAAD
jgi:DNA-binding transcriptional ArsR family regulator